MKTIRYLKTTLFASAMTLSSLLSLRTNAANIPDPNGDGQINISDSEGEFALDITDAVEYHIPMAYNGSAGGW